MGSLTVSGGAPALGVRHGARVLASDVAPELIFDLTIESLRRSLVCAAKSARKPGSL